MTCTVINCHQPRPPALPQADFIDPKAGKVLSTVYLTDNNQAKTLGHNLTDSGKWKVMLSLSPGGRGLWRAVRLSLLDRNCPNWREQAEDNAQANRR